MDTTDLLWRDEQDRGHMPRYLSPSAFLLYEADPVGYYWKYLAPKEYRPGEFQRNYMAAGSIFDALVKLSLDPDCGASVEDKVDPDILADGITLARSTALFEEYKRTPAYDALPDGIVPEPTADKVVTAVIGDEVEIPIGGIPDAYFPGGILDWKVSGSMGKNGGRLPKGFAHLWTEAGSVDRPMHKKCNEPLEVIDSKWATQLTFYAWIENAVPRPGDDTDLVPIRAIIENLVCPPFDEDLFRSGDLGPLTVARIDTDITVEFQRNLFERLLAAWTAIEAKQIIPPDELAIYPDFANFHIMTT